jgi:hypothetical protein
MTRVDTTIQIDDKVSSFMNTFCNFENRLIPNNINMFRNYEDDHELLEENHGGIEDQQGVCKSSWRPKSSRLQVHLGVQE